MRGLEHIGKIIARRLLKLERDVKKFKEKTKNTCNLKEFN